MARKFTRNGSEYSDTPAGRLLSVRDDWDTKLRAMGHSPTWAKTASNTYSATCAGCGRELSCGEWGTTTSHLPDIRHNRCA